MNNQTFIHEKAIVEPGANVGAGTKVWAFVHVLPGADNWRKLQYMRQRVH
jgi:UDP-2-acetamido-3-amino-2,3-dideoxy-glucuronate N-acetyltransferase